MYKIVSIRYTYFKYIFITNIENKFLKTMIRPDKIYFFIDVFLGKKNLNVVLSKQAISVNLFLVLIHIHPNLSTYSKVPILSTRHCGARAPGLRRRKSTRYDIATSTSQHSGVFAEISGEIRSFLNNFLC